MPTFDFLIAPWEQARGYLREELNQIQTALDTIREAITIVEPEDTIQRLNTLGTQNDYGLGDSVVTLLVSSDPMVITGFADGIDGRTLQVLYTGTGSCTFSYESSLSIISNRFLTPDGLDLIIGPEEGVVAIYDAEVFRWRVF